MFKRLFSFSEIEKTFEQCQINKSHEFCYTKPITDLYNKYNNQSQNLKNFNININITNTNCKDINITLQNPNRKKNNKKEQLIQSLINKFHADHDILKIKCLIVMHRLIKKSYDENLITIISNQLEQTSNYFHQPELITQNKEKLEIKIQLEKQEFIKKNVIIFYIHYLKKVIMNLETIKFVDKYIEGYSLQGNKSIDIVNKGFVILNLINYIITAQQTFNKMGRYFKNHKQNLSLFINLLQDLTIYNTFVKEISKLSVNNISKSTSQQIKHYFLFVNQAQKSSDRLYQFFYNRYYYEQVKNVIMMPRFMSFNHQEYSTLVNYVKKRDRELVISVKNSKYETRSKSISYDRRITKTQENQSQNSTISLQNSKMPQTERYEEEINNVPSTKYKNNQKHKSLVEQKKHLQGDLQLLQPNTKKKVYF